MGRRGTITLALLVMLGAAVLWYEGAPPEERPRSPDLLGEPKHIDPANQVPPLLEFNPTQISAVTLSRGDRRLVATRQGDSWSSVAPADTIPDFLNNLGHLGELMRLEAGPAALREYGLDPPQAEIELQRETGEPLVILLGDHSPATTGTYVRIGRTGHVALAGALISWEFDKAYKALGG